MMKKVYLRSLLALLCLGLVLFLGACSSSTDTTDEETTKMTSTTSSSSSKVEDIDKSDAINAVMELKGGQKVEIALYPHVAPQTVDNFVKLVNEGFYDGLTFHRVIPGFVIQTGDPTATGTGGSAETVVGEFSANGFANDLGHTRGVLSMARTNDPDSASSQFFIVLEEAPHLDGNYAAFGEVTSGMEIIDEIAGAETDANDKPLEDQVIEKLYIVE